MTGKLFGTDGIRGIANDYPLNIQFCIKLADILGLQICQKHRKVAIARDTRISGQMLFNALAAGFNAQGIDVVDLGIIPTPLCTTLTPKLGVDMSIMITASHNPYRDNGLKLINADGDKFSDEQTAMLEKSLNETEYNFIYSADNIGTVIKLTDCADEYFSAVQKICSSNALQGMKIALDSANGVFSKIMPDIFRFLGAEIISIADQPDGFNINEDCGSQHTENLSRVIIEKHCALGIAVDGDGDRIIICDENGKRLDGDQIIAYLATYMQKHHLLKGNGIVSTIYSNLGLGKYIRALGLTHYTTAVGERYVIEKMRETNCNLGGEESGHMVLSDYTRTGDALLAAIIVCLGIYESKNKVSDIFPVFTPFPSESRNLRFENKDIINQIMNNNEFQSLIADISEDLKGHGNILVRKSGTEPVIRLKIEDENANIAMQKMSELLQCIEKIS